MTWRTTREWEVLKLDKKKLVGRALKDTCLRFFRYCIKFTNVNAFIIPQEQEATLYIAKLSFAVNVVAFWGCQARPPGCMGACYHPARLTVARGFKEAQHQYQAQIINELIQPLVCIMFAWNQMYRALFWR